MNETILKPKALIDSKATQDLHVQIQAAKLLLDNLKDIVAGDEQLAADMVEGETDLLGAIERAIALVCQDETHIDAIGEHIKKLKARQDGLKRRANLTRAAIAVAMKQATQKKLQTPLGTASIRLVPAAVEIEDESAIPARFWIAGDPKLSKKALLDELKSGAEIPGARLGEPGETISIRV